jgi:hypothetical protein
MAGGIPPGAQTCPVCDGVAAHYPECRFYPGSIAEAQRLFEQEQHKDDPPVEARVDRIRLRHWLRRK